MASEMLMAYGDHGLEPTPAEEVIEVPVLQFARHPVTGGNVGIPVTIRALKHVFGTPARLTGISLTDQPWPCVTWRDSSGKRGSCYVRNVREAIDPLFDRLPAKSRARIVRAVAMIEA